MFGIKQWLENKFKGFTLESEAQKLSLIQLLLVIGALLAAFNLVKDWIWLYPVFTLLSIFYFLKIQKPINSKGQKDAISLISFMIAVIFSGISTGNLFISIPKAILSPSLVWYYVVAILLLFLFYLFYFNTMVCFEKRLVDKNL